MKPSENIWIETGYELFALKGEESLKIEMLARKVGISKSSFYHHFADKDVFVEALLKHHLNQAKVLANKEKMATSIDPEMIHILLAHKTDLLFNRQLRIHKHNKIYAETLMKSNQQIGNDFILIWQKDLQLNLSIQQLEGLFELALDNFFLQINPENLNYAWLSAFFSDLKKIARKFV